MICKFSICMNFRCHCRNNWFGVHCTEQQDVCEGHSNLAVCGYGTCSMDSNGQRQCFCTQGNIKFKFPTIFSWVKRLWIWDKSYLFCILGWSKDSDGRCTVDIDECSTQVNGQNRCSRNPPVTCINTPGSFRCSPCPQGKIIHFNKC